MPTAFSFTSSLPLPIFLARPHQLSNRRIFPIFLEPIAETFRATSVFSQSAIFFVMYMDVTAVLCILIMAALAEALRLKDF